MIEAFREAKRRVPALRMVVVTGPRIDPGTFSEQQGLEVRGFIPELYRHLAACDLAIVQGGLTTCMELTAPAVRSFTFRCTTTSSRTSMSATGSTSTAPDGCSTSTLQPRCNRDHDHPGDRPPGRLSTRRARRCRTSRGPHRRAALVLRRFNYRADLSGVLLSTVELLILRRPLSLINPYAVRSRITRPSLK